MNIRRSSFFLKGLVSLLILFFIPVLVAVQARVCFLSAELSERAVTLDSGAGFSELQSLLDENKEGKYRLTVYVPAGTYKLTGELVIYSNTTLKSEYMVNADGSVNEKTVFIRDNDKYGSLLACAPQTENITIDGGIWDGAGYHSGESLCFVHSQNVKIEHCEVKNAYDGGHLISFAGVHGGIIDGCILHGYNGKKNKEAVHLDIVHSEVQVPNLFSNDTAGYDDAACEDITMNNCCIYDYPRGIGSHYSVKGVYHSDISITGNYFHDLSAEGIYAYNYYGMKVSGNTFKRVGLAVRLFTKITDDDSTYADANGGASKSIITDFKGEIQNNIIDTTTGTKSQKSGYGIEIIGSADRVLGNIKIRKNRFKNISNVSGYAIRAQYAQNLLISSNIINNTENGGITLVNSNNCRIISNVIKNVSRYGIYLSASQKNTIKSNTVDRAGNNGIVADAGSDSCIIDSNKVNRSGKNGIAVYSASNKAVIRLNAVNLSKNHGIIVYKADSAAVKSNTVKDSTLDGINIGTSKNTKVYSNKVTGSGRNSISVVNSTGCNVKTEH